MKLLVNSECHESVGDSYQFEHSIIFYADGDDIYQALVPLRYKDDEINLADLREIRIPPENIYPRFDATILSSAPDPIPDGCFLKKPNLIYYRADDTSQLFRVGDRFLEEALLWEQLMKSPHRNIARYMGCQVKGGRVIALCFKKYRVTLIDRAGEEDRNLNKPQVIHDVRKGIEHLHSFGHCHNDINPHNFMLDEHDTAVIIDFDSSRPSNLGYASWQGLYDGCK